MNLPLDSISSMLMVQPVVVSIAADASAAVPIDLLGVVKSATASAAMSDLMALSLLVPGVPAGKIQGYYPAHG